MKTFFPEYASSLLLSRSLFLAAYKAHLHPSTQAFPNKDTNRYTRGYRHDWSNWARTQETCRAIRWSAGERISERLFCLKWQKEVKSKVKWKFLSGVWLFATPCNLCMQPYTVHGNLQVGILEWVALPFSRSSPPRDRTQISSIADNSLPAEPQEKCYKEVNFY